MTAHLMDKGLDECLDPDFEYRLPLKVSGLFNLTTDDGKKFVEAVLNNQPVEQSETAYESRQAIPERKRMKIVERNARGVQSR